MATRDWSYARRASRSSATNVAHQALVHVDIKNLSRIVRPGHRVTGDRSKRAAGAGWQYLYVAINGHSRLGFAAIHSDETADSALASGTSQSGWTLWVRHSSSTIAFRPHRALVGLTPLQRANLPGTYN